MPTGKQGPSCPIGPTGRQGPMGMDDFTVVTGVFSNDTFLVKRSSGDPGALADPEFKPIFICSVPNIGGVPTHWYIIVVPGEPDVFYKSDPRKLDLHREWPLGRKFPIFRPIHSVIRIGRNNRLARYARAMVHKWMMEKFTFLQTEGSPRMEPAGSSVS